VIVANEVRLAEAYLGIAGLVCQLTLLAMQLSTYRKTKHPSLAILAIGSALAILYLVPGFVITLYAPRTMSLWWLYMAMEIVLFSTQIVLGIWGSASLFRAFADRCSGNGLDSSPPNIAMARSGGDFGTDASGVTFETGIASTMARLSRLWTLRRLDSVAGLATERSVWLLALCRICW
jgi:hypothetical protein